MDEANRNLPWEAGEIRCPFDTQTSMRREDDVLVCDGCGARWTLPMAKSWAPALPPGVSSNETHPSGGAFR